ncbi:Mitochondrial inner membrane protein COX18 [Cyberlindnera fabianii]|uniref:Mitochondrial inner membrane protein COX18 n=1 Tax=Cyberlindnera fabianii TaxID=36022 RepID=A0A1V2LCY4_CYBFA|nr:Mitochondrial inner membrane protein COX18 [Cyberlindnera fabianii]
MTSTMEAAKVMSGLPWWLFIPATTIAVRATLTLPLAIIQRKRLQIQASLRPIVASMGPILRLKLAQRAVQAKAKETSNTQEGAQFIKGAASALSYDQIVVLTAKERRKRQQALFKDHGCEMWKNMLLPVMQIPIWIALSATFRELSGFTDVSASPLDPTLTLEGIKFATDLSIADPTGILPIALGTLMITNVEWNYANYQLTRTSVSRSKRITPQESLLNLARFGAVFLMAISTQAPAALVLYWISSNLFSLLQNMVFGYFPPC